MCYAFLLVLDFPKELSDMFDPTKGKHPLYILPFVTWCLAIYHCVSVLKKLIFSLPDRDHERRPVGGLDVI